MKRKCINKLISYIIIFIMILSLVDLSPLQQLTVHATEATPHTVTNDIPDIHHGWAILADKYKYVAGHQPVDGIQFTLVFL